VVEHRARGPVATAFLFAGFLIGFEVERWGEGTDWSTRISTKAENAVSGIGST